MCSAALIVQLAALVDTAVPPFGCLGRPGADLVSYMVQRVRVERCKDGATGRAPSFVSERDVSMRPAGSSLTLAMPSRR